MTDARKPDMVLKAMNKATDRKAGKIGVAWYNTDGSITLRLNDFVVVPNDPDWLLTLFPTEERLRK